MKYKSVWIAGWSALLLVAGCKSVPLPSAATTPQGPAVRVPRDQDAYAPAEQREGRRRTRRGRPEEQAAAGQFDFYLLNLSWSPEFCATHTSPECGKGLGFVVHGLWPQDNNGNYPEDCSDAPGPSNPGADTDIYPTVGLVEHEWTTHGTCSGLPADAYFAAVHKAFAEVKLPDVPAESIAPGALVSQLQAANPSFPTGSFGISCGNNRLTAVEVCFDKNLNPEACQGVRTCRANVIQVTGP